MIIVRYITLAALVLWLGVMLDERFGDTLRRAHLVSYGCGSVIVAGLFALKFLGPPPAGFLLRAGIAMLMLTIALAAAWLAPRGMAPLLLTVNIVLGFVLLIWYARE